MNRNLRMKVKKFFLEKNINWEVPESNLTLIKKYPSFFKDGKLDIDFIKTIMPQQSYYYNTTKGFLTEYLPAKKHGGYLLADDDLVLKYHKNLLKLKLAPKEIRRDILKKIIEISKLLKKNIKKNTFIILTSQMMNRQEKNKVSMPTQADLIYLDDNNCWKPISLKTSKNKNKNFGFKNTSPKIIDPQISDFIKSKENKLWSFFNKKMSQKEKKLFIENNKIKNFIDDYSKQILSDSVDRLISYIESSDQSYILNLLTSLCDNTKIKIIGCSNNIQYTKQINPEKIKVNLKIKKIGNTAFSIDDKYFFRLKYCNGNMASSVKMQVDFN